MMVPGLIKIIIPTTHWPHKTGSRKQNEFVGTKTLQLIPKHLHTLPLHRLKLTLRNGFFIISSLINYYKIHIGTYYIFVFSTLI